MTISTVDQLMAALGGNAQRYIFDKSSITTVADQPSTLWKAGGNPSAGANPASASPGVIPTDALAGALSFVNPGGTNKLYLANAACKPGAAGIAWLCDRLWHAGTFAPDTTNDVVNGTTITRTPTGTLLGLGVEAWIEIATTFAATAHTLSTVNYTDADGNAQATASEQIPASAIADRMFRVPLANNRGIKSWQNHTGSSTPASGAYSIVLLRRLAAFFVAQVSESKEKNFADLGLPELPNDSALFWMVQPVGTSSGQLICPVTLAEG